MKLAESKSPNKLFAWFIAKQGFSHYLKRMRKTMSGYRCMFFEMDIEKSKIVKKRKYRKNYGGYTENLTDITTYEVEIDIVDGKEIGRARIVSQETLPYWL